MNTRSRIALALAATGLTGTLALTAGLALLTMSCTFSDRSPELSRVAAPAPEPGYDAETISAEEAPGAMDTGVAPPPPVATKPSSRPAPRPAARKPPAKPLERGQTADDDLRQVPTPD